MAQTNKTFSLFDFCKKRANKVQIYGKETLDEEGNVTHTDWFQAKAYSQSVIYFFILFVIFFYNLKSATCKLLFIITPIIEYFL